MAVYVNLGQGHTDTEIHLTYWTSSISENSATNIGSTFGAILRSITDVPDLKVKEVEPVSAQAGHQIAQWNDRLPERLEACIDSTFVEQALLRPEAQAICGWNGTFTYQQLNTASSKLASFLVNHGVGPESLVPFCFEKSVWAIVAMLSILKAGGACVAIDPSHPTARIEAILDEIDAKMILTSPKAASVVEKLVGNVLKIDQAFIDSLGHIAQEQWRPERPARPDNAAIVVFTSGSTGKPKGVVLEHSSICTSIRAHSDVLDVGSHSRVLQFAAYVFDVSLEDIFTTLLRGGCVCVPSEEERMNDLSGAINRMDVNTACLTTTVADLIHPDAVPKLQTLSYLGEPVTRKTIKTWKSIKKLHNTYGPAECTICCSQTRIDNTTRPSNIGKGLASLLWVVEPEDHNKLVPIGCVGELLVEGPLLSRGYLNDPVKTSASFITNPAFVQRLLRFKENDEVDRRMYKTGDLVRMNSDGTLTYVGRKDTQTKINGQRIELGEIEYHVKQHLERPCQVVVEAVKQEDKSDALVTAFVCFTESTRANVATQDLVVGNPQHLKAEFSTLESSLVKTLPGFMIPKLYVPLDCVPLNSSGKTDRKKLRELVTSMSGDQRKHLSPEKAVKRAPTSQVQKTMQALWERALGLDINSVGLDDNFFRLGGDSIFAMRLVTAAREVGIALTVADIFRKPTLEELVPEAVPEKRLQTPSYEPFQLTKNKTISAKHLMKLMKAAALQSNVSMDDVEDVYPCTPLQEGLVVMSKIQPGAYVARNVFQLPSNLDIGRFKMAWQSVAAAIDSLRARIVHLEDFGPQQVVVDEKILWKTAESLEEYIEEDKQIVVDFGSPLTRYAVIEESPSSRYFVWTAHHAAYDGWSIRLILQHVESAYATGSPPDSPSFAPFIDYISKTDGQTSDSFWEQQFDGATPPAFPSPARSPGDRMSRSLSRGLKLSRKTGSEITLPTVIRAAWALISARYSEVEESTFGVTLSGRDLAVPDIATMVGPTITTVPVRVQIKQQQQVIDFLKGVQDQAATMIEFGHAGLQHIRTLSDEACAACDFKSLLVIQPGGTGQWQSSMGLQKVATGNDDFHTYPLVLECRLGQEEVEFIAEYDERSIHTHQIQWILGQLEHVTHQLWDRKEDTSVNDLSLFSMDDKLLLSRWHQSRPERANTCVHDIIAQQILTRPDSSAVCSWDGDFTYAELDKLSTRVAHTLTALGVGPEVMVPILFEKSKWTIIAMLGILKAGGAFVPLDASSPPGRLHMIVQDLNAKLAVVSSECANVLSPILGTSLCISEATVNELSHEKDHLRANTTCQPNNTAYVIYTSGTTGKPKGTMIEHAAFCSSSAEHGEKLGIIADTRALQFASYSFDASLVEILTVLMHGGCVCVPDDHRRLNNVADVINDTKVNWALLTPSFVATIDASNVPGLHTLVLGGEKLTEAAIATWSDSARLINAYGPTESSVIASVNPCIGRGSDARNIGQAVGCVFWVTEPNDHNRLAPIGTVGELLLEGPTLARCYLNESKKTDEAFIVDPTWACDTPKSITRRFYKTGDLVCYNSDGSIDYIARKDTQIKLHGQRIEIGEIEHHLLSDERVRTAMIVFPEQGRYKESLVAIITLRDIESISGNSELHPVLHQHKDVAEPQLSALKDLLYQRLPGYMVPSVWVVVQNIPLSASGKLDRRTVSAWVRDVDEETHSQIVGFNETEKPTSPTTAIGRKLQQVVGHVLNLMVERVILNRSFLQNGGDSITAMQVVSRARTEGMIVSVQDVMKSRSLSELALIARPITSSFVPEEDHVGTFFDLSPIQKMYFEMAEQHITRFHQSIFLRLRRIVETQDLIGAIEAIVRQHSMLRSRFQFISGERWAQCITKDVRNSYNFRAVHDVTQDNIKELLRDSHLNIDIQKGPVFDICLLNLIDGGQCLFLNAHHLIIDAVSWRIILKDLEEILQSGTLSTENPLPFQSWLTLQAQHAKERLSISKSLPFGVQRPQYDYWGMEDQTNVYGDAVAETFQLDISNTELLLGSCNEAFTTEPVDILIATMIHSFDLTFADRALPTVFTEGHGREPWDPEIDLSRTVGWFTTMSPLSVETENRRDMLRTLQIVKDLRRKLPGNGWPYFATRFLSEEGVEACRDHWPMEILFNYLGRYQQLERNESLFSSEPRPDVPDVAADVPRLALFELSVAIVQGSAHFTVNYNRKMQRQSDLVAWASTWKNSLGECVSRLSHMAQEWTVSDFPLLLAETNDVGPMKTSILQQAGIETFAEVEDIYPCSPMQRGLQFSQMRNANNYEVSFMFEVASQSGLLVDSKRLEAAWMRVVNRHAALRTIFVDTGTEDPTLSQLVLKTGIPIVQKLSCSSEDDAVSKLGEHQPMEAGTSRLPHRLTLCTTSPGRIYLRLEINHALIDAISMGIVIQDIGKAYESSLASDSGPLYSDYVKYLQSKDPQDSISYWRNHLSGIDPCFFPTDAHLSEKERKLETLVVDPKVDFKDLQSFCNRLGVTVSNLFQLVWGLVLKYYTNSPQICFGYLVSGRDIAIDGIDAAVGPFINMLICRMNLLNGADVAGILEQTQLDYLASLEHQHCSIAEIQHGLGFAGSSLFNTVVSIQRSSKASSQSSLSFKSLGSHDPTEVRYSCPRMRSTLISCNSTMLLSTCQYQIPTWQSPSATGARTCQCGRLIMSQIHSRQSCDPLSKGQPPLEMYKLLVRKTWS